MSIIASTSKKEPRREKRACDSSNEVPSWEPRAGYGSVCKRVAWKYAPTTAAATE